MYTLYFVLVFLTHAWSLPGQWQAKNCPEQCTCVMEGNLRTVYCDIEGQRQLQAIPDGLPHDAQHVTLRGNRISTISAEAFVKLRDLRYLNLASNELQSLPQNIFQGLTSLESLNLSRNKLHQLPSGLLQGLNSLRHLYLDGNVLENLPADFFQGLTSLRRLYLDSNKFYTLSHNLFGFRGARINTSPTAISNLTSLVELVLDHNGIAQVHHDSFNKMLDLKRLKLNNNNITTLPRGIFSDLKSLRLLSLYRNPFQCTCSLKWLKDWIVQNAGHVHIFNRHWIQCEGPARLRGKGILQVKDREFGCPDEWTEWSPWNTCSKLCNNGRQNRSRQCKAGAGRCEGARTETRWCNTHRCDPDWSSWSMWTPCSVTCSVGYQARSRSAQCSAQSPCQQQIETEVRACARKDCPSYTEWSSWSMCNTSCGPGTQVRTRKCTTTYLGVHCPGSRVETQDCKIRDCIEWAEWGAWSACSKSCSRGEQTRERECVTVFGVEQECPGNSTDTQACNLMPCPVNGGWSSWQPWSSCSKTCGVGFNTRQRKCSQPYPQHGGAGCKGKDLEVTHCTRGICTDDVTEFTAWSNWSDCSVQCGQGFESRHRSCRSQDPDTDIDMCYGNTREYRLCEGERCEGVWGEWRPWSGCMGKCYQGGNMFRWRFCLDHYGRVGYKCNNKTFDIENRTCTLSRCNNRPVWSGWSGWSSCSRSCSGGTKRRWRYCLTKIIGKPCPGNHESKADCNRELCPVHGGWSSWGEWGKCSEPCNGGIKQRNRSCTEPVPQHNGLQCIGDMTDKEICNNHRCQDSIQSDKKVTDNVKEVKTSPKDTIILGKSSNCPNPEVPRNGKYIIKKQKDTHLYLHYKCDDYYRNRGHSGRRFCEDAGTWSGEPADCVLDCGEIKENSPEKRTRESKKIIRNLTDFWPWQVAIDVPSKGVHCGGSLIGDQWVLTAAHCVLKGKTRRYFEDIKVILGTYNSEDTSSEEVQVIPVNKTLHHHRYNRDSHSSDIAILKLERKVHITKYVHPVCLPKRKGRNSLVRAGYTGIFVGWGGTQEPNILRQMSLPVVERTECELAYRPNKYTVTSKMLCAGYKDGNHGLRQKDSGGGFVFLEERKNRNRWVLGGIASWRHPNRKKYSVFTDVRKHVSWIRNKMADLS